MRKALSCLVVSVLLGLGLASVPRGETAGAAGISKAGPVAGGGRSWKPHVRSAKRYARDRAGEVRFAFIDLGGRMHKFHAAQTVPSASVIKVMFLAAYLRRDSVRHRDLNQSEKDLLSPMIRRSDNDAASRVSAIVGPAAIEALARDAHMRDFRYDPQVWGLSRISSRDQATFMYHLGRYIPRRHWHYARKLLSSIVPSQRWAPPCRRGGRHGRRCGGRPDRRRAGGGDAGPVGTHLPARRHLHASREDPWGDQHPPPGGAGRALGKRLSVRIRLQARRHKDQRPSRRLLIRAAAEHRDAVPGRAIRSALRAQPDPDRLRRAATPERALQPLRSPAAPARAPQAAPLLLAPLSARRLWR